MRKKCLTAEGLTVLYENRFVCYLLGIIPLLFSLLIPVGPSETSDIISFCLILEQPKTVNLTVLY